MNRFLSFSIVLILTMAASFSALAAPPRTISYQGYLKDADGVPVTAKTSLTFSLYSSNPHRNNPLWSEKQAVTPDNGVFSVSLGQSVPLGLPFDAPYYLGIRVGDNPLAMGSELTPLPLASTPYAFRAMAADNADRLGGLPALDFLSKTDAAASYLPLSSLANLFDVPRTVTGLVTFNPTASMVPFMVDWTKQGMVQNLNAEKVGGQRIEDLDKRYQPAQQTTTLPPQQVALLRWDQVPAFNPSTATGSNPKGVAFDGTHVWVANTGSNTVSKFLAADATLVGTYPVGDRPWGIAFDGTYVWTANSTGSGSATSLYSSSGSPAATVMTGQNSAGVVFDGGYVWISNMQSGSVTKIRAADGVVIGTYDAGVTPLAMAFDGTHIWVTNYYANKVTRLLASNGSIAGTYPVGTYPQGIAFDGTSVWVTGNVVTRLAATGDNPGTKLGEYNGGRTAIGIAFDGANIWVANQDNDTVSKLSGRDGSLIASFPVKGSPYGVAFDGSKIWVTSADADVVTRIPLGTTSCQDGGIQVYSNGIAQCGTVIAVPNAAATCISNTCTISACTPGYGNCDGNAVNGCETVTTNNPSHCGGCGLACGPVPNGTPGCVNSACGVASCTSGFGNCDGVYSNGCEANLLASASHCGACNNSCSNYVATLPNTVSSGSCVNGACESVCKSGFSNCDGNMANGCETPTAIDPQNCGACGNTCLPNGTGATCVAGQCNYETASCNTNYASCDGISANGCETQLLTDDNNCGFCGNACTDGAKCRNGQCKVAECSTDDDCGSPICFPSFCSYSKVCTNQVCTPAYTQSSSNGCKIDSVLAPVGTRCGISGQCDNLGNCLPAPCQSGYAECDGNLTNVCETNLRSDSNNCGACGTVCKSSNQGSYSPGCVDGTCEYSSCGSGLANCDGIDANGCETNIQTAVANCGACGHSCSAPSVNGIACSNGGCNFTAAVCTTGYTNCSGNLADGCVDLQNDDANCGACGHACGAGKACYAGSCVSSACSNCYHFDRSVGGCVSYPIGTACTYQKPVSGFCFPVMGNTCTYEAHGHCNQYGICQ